VPETNAQTPREHNDARFRRVDSYEKYFTDAEMNELIAWQKETSKTAVPSPALKEKLAAVMPALMADAIGDRSQRSQVNEYATRIVLPYHPR
jgi:hypothetical protein